jgi:ribonucleoside-diphosphate reductase beta chain
MLLIPRVEYKPFEYERAFKFWLDAHASHWNFTEIPMDSDIQDWKSKLSESEKTLIGNILKGFAQTEVFIEDYWSNKVSKWFKKPEIQAMAHTFAAFESIHSASYDYLNEVLDLRDYKAFLSEPTTKAKIDRLINMEDNIPLSLAVFSGFAEGVSLFSSFAILLRFQMFNKMKGMASIIRLSIIDETAHSDAGCWLFRTFVSEYPETFTDELKKSIYEAARLTVKLEDDFIDFCFGSESSIIGIEKEDLKEFIRHRANTKLSDLGLKKNWKNIDTAKVSNIAGWFTQLSSGQAHGDFFAVQITDYSKNVIKDEDIF